MTSKYVIHACPQRMWYVEEHLVPTMKQQGINNIMVKCDTDKLGNLESCMKIFMSMYDDPYYDADGAWHLQDDVIICSNFKELSEEYDSGIVCGYVYTQDHVNNTGYVKPHDMWYSFPCIRIPNKIARECAKWFYTIAKHDSKCLEWVKEKKFDDSIFKEFLIQNYPDIDVLNLVPNLVDHIDFLIGGSSINGARMNPQTRANYFQDGYLVSELAAKLKNI